MNLKPFFKLAGRQYSGARSARPTKGGRLLRRTFGVALILVSAGLVTSGALELAFRYREIVTSINALQLEMAKAAAFKIQQFVHDIEKTMRATTQTQETVASGLSSAIQFDLIKMMKVTPAITTVIAADNAGREITKASRVQSIGTEAPVDLSSDEAYRAARTGRS